MLACSSTYHKGNWSPKTRAWLKRLDHSSIFVLIAGTYTPVCMLALEDSIALRLMVRASKQFQAFSQNPSPPSYECGEYAYRWVLAL